MYTTKKIIDLLKEHKLSLSKKYPISELGLFGSFASGKYSENSDIDILVDFHHNIDGFDYIRLAHEFEDLFNHKIDLVSRKGIKPKYLPFVEKHLIHV
nr:nucleotidyltransferase family protein [Pseudopedobacter sp.]